MGWPELYIDNYEDVLPVMARLGLKCGYSKSPKDTHDPSLLGNGGKLLIKKGNVYEERDESGVTAVHLGWNPSDFSVSQLLEMMSVDSVLFEALKPPERRHLESSWVPGQARVVVVTCPVASVSAFWRVLEKAKSMAEGACRLHYVLSSVHPDRDLPNQFGKMFSGLFESVTVPPNGTTITLPNGGTCEPPQLWDRPHAAEWLRLVGFDMDEVGTSGPIGVRNRRALSVASALWASRNWHDPKTQLETPADDPEWAVRVAEIGVTPEVLDAMPAAKIALRKKGSASPVPVEGDMIACNSCTLFDQCRLARAGAICTLPESDMGDLAEFFKTRDAQKVIEGLGILLGKQADRVETIMAEEAASDGESAALRADVTKMVHGLFDRGVKLAQLNDPRLKGGPQVQVSLTQNAVGQITQGSPQQLAAGLVAELESRGVRREDITPELIEATLAGGGDITDAVEVFADPVIGILPEGR